MVSTALYNIKFKLHIKYKLPFYFLSIKNKNLKEVKKVIFRLFQNTLFI